MKVRRAGNETDICNHNTVAKDSQEIPRYSLILSQNKMLLISYKKHCLLCLVFLTCKLHLDTNIEAESYIYITIYMYIYV